MKSFTREEQVRFWSQNTEPLKGEAVSGVILGLASRWVGSRLLDVGAGSGALLKRYAALRPDGSSHGIDLAPRSPLVQEGDCTALPFQDGSFDTVACTDVIEHLGDADLARCLSEIRRVLAPGGHAVFSTINEERLEESTAACPECGCKFHRWGHCQVFDETRLRSLLAGHGLDVVKVVKTHLHLRASHPVLAGIFYALRLHRALDLRNLTGDIVVVARARSLARLSDNRPECERGAAARIGGGHQPVPPACPK